MHLRRNEIVMNITKTKLTQLLIIHPPYLEHYHRFAHPNGYRRCPATRLANTYTKFRVRWENNVNIYNLLRGNILLLAKQ